MSKTLQSALALSTLALLAGCLGGNDSSILAGGDGPTVTNPNEETPVELEPGDGIRVLSNRADLISDGNALVERLRQQSHGLPPAQRPKQWRICPELATNPQGKWQRKRWQAWLQSQESQQLPESHG